MKIVKLKEMETPLLVRRARGVFEELSNRMSGDLAIEDAPPVLEAVKGLKEVAESLYAAARNKILPLLAEKGETLESGSKVLVVGNYQLEARIHRSGLDSKKVEALLRKKKLDVDKYMEKEVKITYKLSEEKAEALRKKLSEAELKACMMETTYALQQPKKITEEEDNGEEE